MVCKNEIKDDGQGGRSEEKAARSRLFANKDTVRAKFTFIDLFAGIGGFRIAMQNLGGECVFSSEWDEKAKQTYEANFGEVPFGDITLEETKQCIPEQFDVLCAGFPCQAFSIAGRRGGFEDTRGTLFFDVAEIIRRHRPKAFFLENVKGLTNHDRGRTLQTILNTLREDLGYFVPEPEIVNAKDFGVPQNRERIFIVGFRGDTDIKDFKYPEPTGIQTAFQDIREKDTVPTKYYLSTQYIDTLRKHKQRHEEKGNGFGYEIISDDGIANAIVVGGMGRERNLVIDKRITDFTPTTNIKGEVNREGIRKMTPREWARLQGFPETFKIPVADASAYKQFGNSVAVPAVQAVAGQVLIRLGWRDA
ncbi:TPA: DNA cytosine methyltransferase [Neisseria lactamica]|uniref:Cytosine-specific methyltransferase n=1 Tax=Neisseria lactamica (strain 020-06) TaxID=489653 RepID=E4ZED5_NEIL0|nr:DNA cytosine methyltransferase [Neisseria lactamica]CBN87720.1 C-5 cytosine-specific DNA-methylase [Neisseria lactamica 020-06]